MTETPAEKARKAWEEADAALTKAQEDNLPASDMLRLFDAEMAAWAEHQRLNGPAAPKKASGDE